MAEHQEHRRKTRVKIVGRLAGRASAPLDIYLLDLSATGARIEHFGLLPPATTCTIELPPELGRLVLSARVVHSTVIGKRQSPDGEQHPRYESGLTFINLTPEQETALAKLLG